jgi:hypothetical protein
MNQDHNISHQGEGPILSLLLLPLPRPSQSEDLAGIENVVRIESRFHGAMHLQHGRGEFAREPVALEQTYAVLAGHRATKIKGCAEDLLERDFRDPAAVSPSSAMSNGAGCRRRCGQCSDQDVVPAGDLLDAGNMSGTAAIGTQTSSVSTGQAARVRVRETARIEELSASSRRSTALPT